MTTLLSKFVYEKCAHCHLFVELADDEDAADLAAYVHLARGDADDNAIENDHDAEPSGERRTLDWWKANGPLPMRARFEVDLYEGFLDLQHNEIYDGYPVTALVEFAYEYPEEGLNAIGDRFGEFNDWLEHWERQGHGKVIMSAHLDRLMPTL